MSGSYGQLFLGTMQPREQMVDLQLDHAKETQQATSNVDESFPPF